MSEASDLRHDFSNLVQYMEKIFKLFGFLQIS